MGLLRELSPLIWPSLPWGWHELDPLRLSSRRGRVHRIGRWSPDMVRKRLEVLDDRSEVELVACTGEAPQPHALEAMVGL